MKITKGGEYALRLLIRLGIHHQKEKSAVPVSLLAIEENVPAKFAESILSRLRVAGYVETIRGKDGGTRLAMPPSDIVLGNVLRLIDGDLAPVSCTSDSCYQRCSCPHEESCGLRMLMIDVHRAVIDIMDHCSLEQMVDIMRLRKPCSAESPLSAPAWDGRSRHHPADGFLAMHSSESPPCVM